MYYSGLEDTREHVLFAVTEAFVSRSEDVQKLVCVHSRNDEEKTFSVSVWLQVLFRRVNYSVCVRCFSISIEESTSLSARYGA